MGLGATAGWFAVSAAVMAFAWWRGERPYVPAQGPRWIPWTLIMLTAAVVCLMLAVHAINELGIETGRGRPGF